MSDKSYFDCGQFGFEISEELQRELETEQRLEKMIQEHTKELEVQIVELKNQINSLKLALHNTIQGGIITLNYALRIEKHVENHLGPLPETTTPKSTK